jgi:hypothetical protein
MVDSMIVGIISWWKKIRENKIWFGNSGQIRRGLWDRVFTIGESVKVVFWNGSNPRNKNDSNDSTRLDLKNIDRTFGPPETGEVTSVQFWIFYKIVSPLQEHLEMYEGAWCSGCIYLM